MKPQEFRDLFARITYKPNVSLWLEPEYFAGAIAMRVKIRVPDVNAPETETHLYGFRSMSPHKLAWMNEAGALEWIEHELLDIERHEFKEWFKLDGVCVRDPHPEMKHKIANNVIVNEQEAKP